MGSDLDGMSETFGIQKLGVPVQVKGCKLILTNRSEQICLWMKFPIYFATTLPSSPSNPITGKLILFDLNALLSSPNICFYPFSFVSCRLCLCPLA
jgi:hypothetical protein